LGQGQGSGWQGKSAGRPDKGLIGLFWQILWKWRPPSRRSLFCLLSGVADEVVE
jgi:hypothetical protein